MILFGSIFIGTLQASKMHVHVSYSFSSRFTEMILMLHLFKLSQISMGYLIFSIICLFIYRLFYIFYY